MKTSNIILIVTASLLTLYLAVQIIFGLGQIERTREAMGPIMERIDNTDIKVIRMERDNNDYIAGNNNRHKANYIYFPHYSPTPEMLRIEGDTLVVATNRRVVVHIPSASHLIEWDGSVKELGPSTDMPD